MAGAWSAVHVWFANGSSRRTDIALLPNQNEGGRPAGDVGRQRIVWGFLPFRSRRPVVRRSRKERLQHDMDAVVAMVFDHKDGRRLRKPYGKHRGALVPLPDNLELAPDHAGSEWILRPAAPSRRVARESRAIWGQDIYAGTRSFVSHAGWHGERAFTALRSGLVTRPPDGRRAVDVAVASTALVATSPVLLFACVAMALTMHRKVFFFQQRHGQHGRRFMLVKLRSLKDVPNRKVSESNAHRLTPVARVIRRFGIDELPQFINVLKGDMSIFGPRPFDIEPDVEGWKGRYAIKPGLIGLASVREKIAGVQSSLEKVTADDLEYIRNRTWRLDAWLLIMATACILTGRIDPQEQQSPNGIAYRMLTRLATAVIG